MNITNITFNNGLYTIYYTNNRDDLSNPKKIVGKISANNIDKESLDRFNFLTEDIRDSFWINQDEYIILLPYVYPCLDEDEIVPLGRMRYYITNHMDEEDIFSFDILESEEEINAPDLQGSISNYLNWY